MPAATRRRAVAGLVSVLAAALTAGCAVDPVTLSGLTPLPPTTIRTTFTLDSGSDTTDQLLKIENDGDSAVAPVLAFTAVDSSDRPLSEVKVFTALGSDRGRVVAPPGIETYDVLQFLGNGAEEVADVEVRVVKAPKVDYPKVGEWPTTTTIAPVAGDKGTFGGVKVSNSNDAALTVRVAYVVWEQESPGRPQPFRISYDVGDLITVPARGSVIVPLEGAALAGNLQYGDSLPWNVQVYCSV